MAARKPRKPRRARGAKIQAREQIEDDGSPPATGPPALPPNMPPITNLQLAAMTGAPYVGDFDWGKLSIKQARFIEAFLGDHVGNATESARYAGYNGDDYTLCILGCALLKKPSVVRALVEIHSATGGSSQEVASRLWQIARDPTGKKSDVLKALEILGKHYNMFEKHQEAKAAPKLVIDLRRKPQEGSVIDVTPGDGDD